MWSFLHHINAPACGLKVFTARFWIRELPVRELGEKEPRLKGDLTHGTFVRRYVRPLPSLFHLLEIVGAEGLPGYRAECVYLSGFIT
jgi:hypothetical protein